MSASVAFLALLFPAGLVAQQVERWEVAPQPEISLGSIQEGNGDLFVSVLMGTELSDGTLVVRNSMRGLFELRYFSPDGTHLASASRWGQGPYEFEVPLGAYRIPGDSILVVGRDARYAVFGPRGERGREGRIDTSGATLASWADYDSGYLVFERQRTGVEQGQTGRVSEFVIALRTGEPRVDTVGVIHGALMRMEREGPVFSGFDAPFATYDHVATGGGLVWIGDSATPQIDAYRPGQSNSVVSARLPTAPRTVTRADRNEFERRAVDRWDGEMGIMWRRASRALGYPDSMPLYSELDVDRAGNLWVRNYSPPWEMRPWTWNVFSPRGVLIASVTVPESALPDCADRSYCDAFLEIGDDYILVSQRDELGVAYLRKFALQKP